MEFTGSLKILGKLSTNAEQSFQRNKNLLAKHWEHGDKEVRWRLEPNQSKDGRCGKMKRVFALEVKTIRAK